MNARTTVPSGYWEDADDYDSDDWCMAVMEGSTRLGYWEWVAEQRAGLTPNSNISLDPHTQPNREVHTMKSSRYEDIQIEGELFALDFRITYDAGQDCILLSTDLDGMGKNVYCESVGHALRELAREIGEG